MKFLDLFAGIGGFRRGMELAGHECVGFCEQDKFAVASYTSMHLLTKEQRKHLETLPLKKRQKEILKEEYKNGEWYADDIRTIDTRNLPYADCWCFGAPCQDFSVAGKRKGLDGDRSSLIREIFRLLEEQEEQDRPEWIVYENVKGMLFSNRGLDYLSILSEMDRLGYDIEWQNIDSKWFVPQNRERIYTVGHLRKFGSRKVLPVEGTARENSVSIIAHRNGYRRNTQTFTADGITETLSTCQGGGRELHVALPCFVDMTIGNGIKLTENARTLQARYNKGASYHSGEVSGVAIYGYAATLDHNCYQGIFVKVSETATIYAVWYEKYQCYIAIRKLTPKECFRLQGWTDDYFEKAAFVNSDSQLYKQAGNGVTVNVVYEIAKRMEEVN